MPGEMPHPDRVIFWCFIGYRALSQPFPGAFPKIATVVDIKLRL
jgi:hypothetical protein